jgi:hypothetical protein
MSGSGFGAIQGATATGRSGGSRNMAARPTHTVLIPATSSAAMAATCRACNSEMRVATSCTIAEVRLADGRVLPRVRFSPLDGASLGPRCPACNIGPGGLHHVGCSLECCPSCGQRTSVCGFRV